MVSSGIDWGTSVRPLLAASYGNVSMTDLLKLARSIQNGQEELLGHGLEHTVFYSSFVALSTHFLSGHVGNIPRYQLTTVSGACGVLAEYLMKRIDVSSDQCAVTPPQLILLVKSLCSGTGCLHRSDIITLAAQMKSSQLPSHIRNSIGPEKSPEEGSGTGGSGTPRQRTASASRNDPLGQIAELLATPLQDQTGTSRKYSGEEKTQEKNKEESGKSVKEQFATENIQILIRLNAASVLLDLCLKLPNMRSHLEGDFSSLKTGSLHLFTSDTPAKDREILSNSLVALSSEVDLVAAVLELRLWDGVSSDILEKLGKVLCACVLGAGSHMVERHVPPSGGVGDTKKDSLEADSNVFILVQQVLGTISPATRTVFRHSIAGQTALQNLKTLESMCTGQVVHHLISHFPLSVGIMEFLEHFQSSVASLLKDVRGDVSGKTEELADLDVSTVSSPAQRLTFMTRNQPGVALLLGVAHRCLDKVRKEMESSPQEPSSSGSAELESMEPLLSPSAIHEDPPLIDADPPVAPSTALAESDSEPLLGTWLEELLSSVPLLDGSSKKKQTASRQLSRRRSTATEAALQGGSLRETTPSNKKMVSMAVDYLKLLSERLLGGSGSTEFLRSHISSVFGDAEIGELVSIIQLLDAQDETGVSEVSFGEVSCTISKLCHNLLVNQYLSDSVEDWLVEKLIGESLSNGQDHWVLRVSCRSLAVFGQLLLLRLHRESGEFGKSVPEFLIVEVWERFLRTLKRSLFAELEEEDLEKKFVNVEHIQLLLLMFHSVQLIQKKTILLILAQTLIDTAEEDRKRESLSSTSTPHLGYLLALLEYMMKHYYEAPCALTEQVRSNIFPVQSQFTRGSQDKAFVKTMLICSAGARHYFPWNELEEASSDVCQNWKGKKGMFPKFYELCPTSWVESDGPGKLCGLGMKTLLSSEMYDKLYQSCIHFLSVDLNLKEAAYPKRIECLSVYYTRCLAWRVLGQLPVSDVWLNGVLSGDLASLSQNDFIHFLRVGGRFSGQAGAFIQWQKEWWEKQGFSSGDVHDDLIRRTGELWSKKDTINKACISFLHHLSGEVVRGGLRPSFNSYIVVSVLRANSSLDDEEDSFNDDPELKREVRTKELEYFKSLAKLADSLHQNARGWIMREVWESESGKEVSRDALECLLEMATIGLVDSVSESNFFSLAEAKVYPCCVSNVLGVWRTEGVQFALDKVSVFKEMRLTLNEDSVLMECYTSGLLSSLSKSLLGGFPAVIFSVMGRILGNVQVFLSNLGVKNRGTDFVELSQAKSVAMAHFFGVLTHPQNCFMLHQCLSDMYEDTGGTKGLVEAENLSFLTYCFRLLRMFGPTNTSGLKRASFLGIIGTLRENVGRSSTWEAWKRLLLETERTLAEDLISTSQAEDSPLISVEWLEYLSLVMGYFTASSGEKDSSISVIVREMVVPMLLDEHLHEAWANMLQTKLEGDSDEDLKRMLDFWGLVTKLVWSEKGAWASTAATLSLDSIISVLSSIRFDSRISTLPSKDYENGLTESDRWANSKLTPLDLRLLSGRGMDTWFNRLFPLVVSLAQVGDGRGLTILIRSVLDWMKDYGKLLRESETLRIMEGSWRSSREKHARLIVALDTCTTVVSFLGAVMGIFGKEESLPEDPVLAYDSDLSLVDLDSEFHWVPTEDSGQAEDEESGEDSGDEEGFDSRLCTFTVTQKEFMNQHWYHCHTCAMVDGEGVCSICAKVCHKDHDLSYSKYGSFFCDCGAKQDGTCVALTKRSRSVVRETGRHVTVAFDTASEPPPPTLKSAFGKALASGSVPGVAALLQLKEYSRTFDLKASSMSEEAGKTLIGLLKAEGTVGICQEIMSLLSFVVPAVTRGAERRSQSGALERRKAGMARLRNATVLDFDFDRTLVAWEMSTQESVLDNVKMNLSGEQGQTIRQLLQSHILHRHPLAILTLRDKKRQFLAVAHDKSKITIFPVSSLLKQAETNKKKLSLSRCAFETMPFTAISLASKEECLAVSGLKECHVLIFASSGTVSDKLILQPVLEAGNFIIKALWIPNSPGLLAVVTADFVNIYDLRSDLKNPLYHFLLPAGKIRDIAFVCWSGAEEAMTLERYLVIISSFGHVYFQRLSDEYSFVDHGPFYVTNAVPVLHPELQDSNGTIAGGGVSVYYSHGLQLLFLSYQQGKNFMVSLSEQKDALGSAEPVIPIMTSKGDMSKEQPLCRWSEVSEHPGLVQSINELSGVPILMYFGPTGVHVQEIHSINKSKALDCLPVVQESLKGEQQTTLIVLCEDGSLQFFKTSESHLVDYWLSPASLPWFPSPAPSLRSSGPGGSRRKRAKSSKVPVSLPVDFFESCQSLNEVEFGGRDVLQFYNVQQLKNRLITNNFWIACLKTGGFDLEIVNKDPNMVVCGVRVEVGKKSLEYSPTYIEVFGRRRDIGVTKTRWYDVPFTREECFQASNKFKIRFGATPETSTVVVDSVKVYGKTKESFGWSEEMEEAKDTSALKANPDDITGNSTVAEENLSHDKSLLPVVRPPLIPEIFLVAAFDTLNAYFAAFPNGNDRPKSAVDLATGLLCTTVHLAPLQKAKCVLRKLCPTKEAYYAHKDGFLLSFVWTSLPKASANKDPDLFAFLLMIGRNIALRRPNNFLQYSTERSGDNKESLVSAFMRIFWDIEDSGPKWPTLAPLDAPVGTNVSVVVRGLVEVLHGCSLGDSNNVPLAARFYADLLLCKDVAVGQACKSALAIIFRPKQKKKRVVIPSPPARCSTPDGVEGVLPPPPPPLAPATPPEEDDEMEEQEEDEDAGPFQLVQGAHGLEALLAAAEDEALEGIPPDADEEAAMVELAIALSLQENGEGGDGVPPDFPPPEEDHLAEDAPDGAAQAMEAGHMSDTTGSGLSDEEGSTAATEGSTLRTSPTEERITEAPESAAASESGASGGESISGRSSTYGEVGTECGPSMPKSDTGSSGGPINHLPTEPEGIDERTKVHLLQTSLLDSILVHFPTVKSEDGGMRCVAYMQTILLLSSGLQGGEERERELILKLLGKILDGLELSNQDPSSICERSPAGEIRLLKLRLLSVLLSKSKGREKGNLSQADEVIATQTARSLMEVGAVEYCRRALAALLDYWKSLDSEKKEPKPKVLFLRRSEGCGLDLSPFFLRQYVKEHASDIFECYAQLITEMALRLPCQMRKVREMWKEMPPLKFSPEWEELLCQFVSCQEAPFVRRQARKLLLIIAGSKEQYRFLRDQHNATSRMDSVKYLCSLSPGQTLDIRDTDRSLNLDYTKLNDLMDHLKVVGEVGSSRVNNWQRLCFNSGDDTGAGVLPFLVRLSCIVNDVISQVVLTLIQSALCPASDSKTTKKSSKHKSPNNGGETEKSGTSYSPMSKFNPAMAKTLTGRLLCGDNRELMVRFLTRFMLQCNVTDRRWQVHSLVQKLFEYGTSEQQEFLLKIFWENLWPDAAKHGAKSSQLVDLIGYYTVTWTKSTGALIEASDNLLTCFRAETKKLNSHPNANLYNIIGTMLDCEGYYLEDNPCLVCNNPEVPMTNMKLSAIKQDSRFTTSSQIVKMVGSHEIAKVTLKLTEIKRAKMVKQLNLFYSNKTVASAVELKNKPELWSLAKQVNLSPAQTDIKMDFPVPIVACNLLVEFAECFEAQKSGSELLHCPRCSASVPANPGVCGNCGENVFQCHKCRSINYDEKDPFLCNSCGFSKYAKFEVTLSARQIASVEPIENEEDRKKTLTYIKSLLEKADQTHKHLQLFRSSLEGCVAKINGHPLTQRKLDVGGQGGVVPPVGSGQSPSSMSAVNRVVQEMALRYSRDCKLSFEELSRIIQRILANRTELILYDSRHGEDLLSSVSSLNPAENSGRCFGCTTAHAMHCVRLLRALSSVPEVRNSISQDRSVLLELMGMTRKGPLNFSQQCKEFLCELSRENQTTTEFLCSVIEERLDEALRDDRNPFLLGHSVKFELQILRSSIKIMDSCWESRLRTVFRLFMLGLNSGNGAALEHVVLPCLQMINWLIVPTSTTIPTQPPMDGSAPPVSLEETRGGGKVSGDLKNWLSGKKSGSFSVWKDQRLRATPLQDPVSIHQFYLMEKFGRRWLGVLGKERRDSELSEGGWLERALFCPNSVHVRSSAVAIFKQLCKTSPERKTSILNLLTKYVDDLSTLGERSTEFCSLFRSMIEEEHWKYYLAIRGFLPHLGDLINEEIDMLGKKEDSSMGTDLTLGYSIRLFAELLRDFFSVPSIRRRWKSQLLSTVLNGYLGLRRLVLQRTKLIEEAQEKLLELLEELTSGTEAETKDFMAACIQTVNKCPDRDMRTPVFVFERLCSIIYPEEKEVGEFLINIEKDPAQEDFLQGRMMGNPYSSRSPGMGPLMKDIKNKICRDCELIALLEDDTGMELLVNNKIVSLELPVSEVYKKLWQPQQNSEAMMVIYRMRGLLGDATEEFVENLDTKKNEEVNEEEVYKMAATMATCGGLEAMLERLRSIRNLVQGRSLLTVLLKLFGFCVKVGCNREKLTDPRLRAMETFLSALEMIMKTGDADLFVFAESLLDVISAVLKESSLLPDDRFLKFAERCGTGEEVEWLLSLIVNSSVMGVGGLKEKLMRITPNLTLGSADRMEALIHHFRPFIHFNKFDFDPPPNASAELDGFCLICWGIQTSANGGILKEKILEAGFVKEATEYLQMHCPPLYKHGSTIDCPEWKDFLSKASLKYILRILAGLSQCHVPTQTVVAENCIPIVHRLEQISTEERLGTLAENLMESLRQNETVAAKIEEVRQETKQNKKKMAMEMRRKQLEEMGMKLGKEGLVKVASPKMKDTEDLGEETGLICSICREGYKFQPQKVIGIYTYTKRVNADEYEAKPRKTTAYTTVTHFNVVHVDCHLSAVKSARGRDEWESAMLHNANTRCNGLLPLWGPSVPESNFANCLARHNAYVQELAAFGDISLASGVQDLKHLLLRFAEGRSFSEETGGGGKESNVQLIPCLVMLPLYQLNTTKTTPNEERSLRGFLDSPVSEWLAQSFTVDGPLYECVLASFILGHKRWKEARLMFLRRILVLAHARKVVQNPASPKMSDVEIKDWSVYKPYCLFFALVDGMYAILYKDLKEGDSGSWSQQLQTFLQQNDVGVLEDTKKLLKYFEEDLVVCEAFDEFCDVTGMLEEIGDPSGFLDAAINSLKQN